VAEMMLCHLHALTLNDLAASVFAFLEANHHEKKLGWVGIMNNLVLKKLKGIFALGRLPFPAQASGM
jgi:hypothetical protein